MATTLEKQSSCSRRIVLWLCRFFGHRGATDRLLQSAIDICVPAMHCLHLLSASAALFLYSIAYLALV
ncbi:MAG: hypothetical protein ACKO3T_01825 [Planctomycetaceae bacterium]